MYHSSPDRPLTHLDVSTPLEGFLEHSNEALKSLKLFQSCTTLVRVFSQVQGPRTDDVSIHLRCLSSLAYQVRGDHNEDKANSRWPSVKKQENIPRAPSIIVSVSHRYAIFISRSAWVRSICVGSFPLMPEYSWPVATSTSK